MKYIFFGTPRFAEIILRGLLRQGIPPMALVCNPDRPVGRKKIVTPPPTKELITKNSVPTAILQPEKLDEVFVARLKELQPDFFVVAAYAKIIPKTVLDIPRLGTLGVHPSLLPKYRGASPIQSVILDGAAAETGVTIYLMDEKMDHGPMIDVAKFPLDGLKTPYLELERKLAETGSALLIRTIPAFMDGTIHPEAQDETRASYTRKFTTEDGFVAEKELEAAMEGDAPKAEAIIRKINAFHEEPGVWTTRNGKRLKLLQAEIQNGVLLPQTVQEEGGKPTTFRSS
jgi:methionyl-tRNA formyltransferase